MGKTTQFSKESSEVRSAILPTKAHFRMVLNRRSNLCFERGSTFIPEEFGFNGKSCIDQAHGVSGSHSSLYAFAGQSWVAESKGLLVATATGDGIVNAQIFIVKEHPS